MHHLLVSSSCHFQSPLSQLVPSACHTPAGDWCTVTWSCAGLSPRHATCITHTHTHTYIHAFINHSQLSGHGTVSPAVIRTWHSYDDVARCHRQLSGHGTVMTTWHGVTGSYQDMAQLWRRGTVSPAVIRTWHGVTCSYHNMAQCCKAYCKACTCHQDVVRLSCDHVMILGKLLTHLITCVTMTIICYWPRNDDDLRLGRWSPYWPCITENWVQQHMELSWVRFNVPLNTL